MSDRKPIFCQLVEPEASALTYILGDPRTRRALIIDPVLETVERDLQALRNLNLELEIILETHLHADHVTGAGALREATGARIAVSRASGILGADLLLEDRSPVSVGTLTLLTLATPGHTQGCVSYYIDGMAFTGDCLLVGGIGRTDLPGGSSNRLYDSVHRVLWPLPPTTQVFPAHDYRGHRSSTIEVEKRSNPRVGDGVEKLGFLQMMQELQLAPPRKMRTAIPANLRCGAAD